MGKLEFDGSTLDAAARHGFTWCEITPRDAEAAGGLEWDHKDPFDRMLVAQAAQQVGEKMAGMSKTDAREDADHTVEVLFKKGGFKLYVDALPLAPMISTSDIDRMRIPTSEPAQPCHDPAGTSCPFRQF